jgi:putative transposase
MRKKRNFEINKEYHLYARGVDRRDTFLSESDYLRFMALLYVCNQSEKIRLDRVSSKNFSFLQQKYTEPLVELKQFCLMPNHFHILCMEITEGGISKFMQKILTGYTGYFNKKHNREGALFSSTYKVKEMTNDLYAQYIRKYIYFNPLKLIRENYDSKNILLYEKESITKEESDFLREYPYKSEPDGV